MIKLEKDGKFSSRRRGSQARMMLHEADHEA